MGQRPAPQEGAAGWGLQGSGSRWGFWGWLTQGGLCPAVAVVRRGKREQFSEFLDD